jgi:hypothetical protein
MNILANLAAIQTPDETQLTTRAQAALRMVESMTIESDEDYVNASDELKAIKAKATSLETQRTGITQPINEALRAINALFKGPGAFLEQAEKTIKGKMLSYSAEKERIAAEARRKAEEEAAAERRRLEEEAAARERVAQAERNRIAAEEKARADAARAEQERLQREAAEAKAKGDAAAAAAAELAAKAQREADAAAAAAAEQRQAEVTQAAALDVAAIQNVAAVVVAAPMVDAPVKVAGVSTAKSVEFEVTNLHDLVKHIAGRPEMIALLKADEVKLRAYVRGLGMNANLPGVRVFEKKTLRAA